MKTHQPSGPQSDIMIDVAGAWSLLGLDDGAPCAIDQIQWKQRSQVYRLRGVGSDDRNVIAKRCRTHMAVVERTVHHEVLALLPVRSPRFLGCVDDPNSEPDDPFSWLFFEDIGPRRFAPEKVTERRRFAEWLATAQGVTLAIFADARPNLPLRDSHYYRGYLERALVGVPEVSRERGFDGEIAQLFLEVHRLLASVDQHWPDINSAYAGPLTIVHGDCLPKNIHVICEPDEPVVPIDWGNAGWGLPGTDLGQSGILFGDDLIGATETDAYAARISKEWSGIDGRTVERWAHLGRLLWSVKVIAMSLPAFECQSRRKTGEILSLYARVLAQSNDSLAYSR